MLPLLIVCEDNGYAPYGHAHSDGAGGGGAPKLSTFRGDGGRHDVLAVDASAAKLVERIRKGEGRRCSMPYYRVATCLARSLEVSSAGRDEEKWKCERSAGVRRGCAIKGFRKAGSGPRGDGEAAHRRGIAEAKTAFPNHILPSPTFRNGGAYGELFGEAVRDGLASYARGSMSGFWGKI